MTIVEECRDWIGQAAGLNGGDAVLRVHRTDQTRRRADQERRRTTAV
ncbi:MAG TPA: hypothetical protein VFB99_10545 [Vicinamibacterales bacterium]|nr:hypothetical protein [Vicinamibacterales bacterium]